MQNKTTLILTVLLLFIYEALFSQVNERANYVIITFEMIRSTEPKAEKKFYWIAPTDSIKKSDFYLFPLYLAQYSKDNLDGCIEGDTIDIFTVTTDTRYNFGEAYESDISTLTSLIDSRRKKVQTIAMKWDKGYKEEVNVYATPINGKFCNCLQNHMVGAKVAFKGLIFIPITGFNFDDNFWASEKSKKILFANYSSVDFSSYLLLYGRSVRTEFE